MSCVTSLSVGLSGDCAAVKKAGGAQKFIYAGSIDDIDSITYDSTDGFITDIAMKTGKQLVKYVGRMEKNTASEPVVAEGEGNVNLYTHTVQPVLYHFTQADRNAIEELFALDQAFFIVPTRANQCITYGIAKEGDRFQDYGLKVSEGDDPLGLVLNDQNAQTATFTGNLLTKALIYGEGETFDANITALDLLLTPAV